MKVINYDNTEGSLIRQSLPDYLKPELESNFSSNQGENIFYDFDVFVSESKYRLLSTITSLFGYPFNIIYFPGITPEEICRHNVFGVHNPFGEDYEVIYKKLKNLEQESKRKLKILFYIPGITTYPLPKIHMCNRVLDRILALEGHEVWVVSPIKEYMVFGLPIGEKYRIDDLHPNIHSILGLLTHEFEPDELNIEFSEPIKDENGLIIGFEPVSNDNKARIINVGKSIYVERMVTAAKNEDVKLIDDAKRELNHLEKIVNESEQIVLRPGLDPELEWNVFGVRVLYAESKNDVLKHFPRGYFDFSISII